MIKVLNFQRVVQCHHAINVVEVGFLIQLNAIMTPQLFITSSQVGNRLNISYNIVIITANTSTSTPATTTSHAMTTIRSTTTTAASNTTTRPSTSTGHKNVETSTTHIRKGSYVPFLLHMMKKRVIRYAFT